MATDRGQGEQESRKCCSSCCCCCCCCRNWIERRRMLICIIDVYYKMCLISTNTTFYVMRITWIIATSSQVQCRTLLHIQTLQHNQSSSPPPNEFIWGVSIMSSLLLKKKECNSSMYAGHIHRRDVPSIKVLNEYTSIREHTIHIIQRRDVLSTNVLVEYINIWEHTIHTSNKWDVPSTYVLVECNSISEHKSNSSGGWGILSAYVIVEFISTKEQLFHISQGRCIPIWNMSVFPFCFFSMIAP